MVKGREKIEILAVRNLYSPVGDIQTIIAMAIHIADENRDMWSKSWSEISEEERIAQKMVALSVVSRLTEAGYVIAKVRKPQRAELASALEELIATAIFDTDDSYTSESMKLHVLEWRREEARAVVRALNQNRYAIQSG